MSTDRPGLRIKVSFPLALLSVMLLAASFAAPHVVDGRSVWTPEKAEQLSQASQQLHQQSFAPPTPANEVKLEQAQVDYNALLAELKAAQQQGNHIAWGLRGLAVVMALVAYLLYQNEQTSR